MPTRLAMHAPRRFSRNPALKLASAGVAALLLSLFGLAAQSACRDVLPATKDTGGFQEAVISVQALEPAVRVWRDIGGYQVICRRSDPDAAQVWGVTEPRAVEVLLRKPGHARGVIRLVRFGDGDHPMIRSSAMPWDTGGIFDLYVIVTDVQATLRELRALGWQSYTDPVEYTASYGGVVRTVNEAIARGPNGEVLVLMQRSPEPEGAAFFAVENGFSWPYNAALVVEDFESARRFFAVALGWVATAEGSFRSPPPGATPTGLPFNIAQSHPRRFAAFTSDSRQPYATIQVLQFEGLVGRDLSMRAAAPARGLLALRVPVADAAAVRARLQAAGDYRVSNVQRLALPPYGEVDLVSATVPGGARIDFFSRVSDATASTR